MYRKPTVFSVLKVEPALGGVFQPDEMQPGKNRVVILSDGMWRRRFGSDQTIIGKSVTLSGNPYTVVGVMPASFRNPAPEHAPNLPSCGCPSAVTSAKWAAGAIS